MFCPSCGAEKETDSCEYCESEGEACTGCGAPHDDQICAYCGTGRWGHTEYGLFVKTSKARRRNDLYNIVQSHIASWKDKGYCKVSPYLEGSNQWFISDEAKEFLKYRTVV